MDDYRAPAPTIEAMRRLVHSVPGATQVLDEHVDDNGGEMLPHLLMADLARWLVDAVVSENERHVVEFLAAVETLYSNDDPDIRNVLAVSFMEYLVINPDESEKTTIRAIRRLSGPLTATALAAEEVLHGRRP